MEKEFLGYAYLNNEIKKIYAEDYPDYKIETLQHCLYLYKCSDIITVYPDKKQLIDNTIDDYDNEITEITSEIDHLKNTLKNLELEKILIKQLEH